MPVPSAKVASFVAVYVVLQLAALYLFAGAWTPFA